MITDIQEFRNMLHHGLNPNGLESLERCLRDIVERNQNPGCGGDGSMTEQQWYAMSRICRCLYEIRSDLTTLTHGGPIIKDSAIWVQHHEG